MVSFLNHHKRSNWLPGTNNVRQACWNRAGEGLAPELSGNDGFSVLFSGVVIARSDSEAIASPEKTKITAFSQFVFATSVDFSAPDWFFLIASSRVNRQRWALPASAEANIMKMSPIAQDAM